MIIDCTEEKCDGNGFIIFVSTIGLLIMHIFIL